MNTASVSDKPRRRFFSPWRTLGVIAGLVLGAMAYQYIPHHDPVRLDAWNKVQPHILSTDKASKNEVNTSTEQIKKFFAERKQNARAFASDVLCFSGKWAYLKGYFYEGNHERYLEECFERNLFSSDELKALIESAVTRYVSEVEGRENQLLVAIRADLDGTELTSPKYLPALSNEANFRREYATMMQNVLPILTKELGVSVNREIVSWVGGEIAGAMLNPILFENWSLSLRRICVST